MKARVSPRRVVDDPAFSFIDRSAVEFIIMGTCKSCKSLLYLGDRTCQRCGAPAGDSLTEDDLDRLYSMFEPNKPEPVVTYPTYGGGMVMVDSDSFCSYTTNMPMVFYASSDPNPHTIDSTYVPDPYKPPESPAVPLRPWPEPDVPWWKKGPFKVVLEALLGEDNG